MIKLNQLKAGVTLSYLSVLIGSIVSVAYTPIMLRLLGQIEYGIYTLAGSVVSYLGVLNFGLGSSYIRFYTKFRIERNDEEVARLNGMFLIVFCVLGAIAFLFGGILALNAGKLFHAKLSASEIEITKTLMGLLALNLALSFPFSLFSSFAVANERYIFQRALALLKSVASPLVSLVVLLMGFRSVGMVLVTIGVNLVVDIEYLVFCKRRLGMSFRFDKLEWSISKEVFIFSLFIFINIIVDQINWNVDKFLLGVFGGTIATAIYGLAGQLQAYYQQFSTMISSVFTPRIHQLVLEKQTKQLSDLFIRVGRVQYLVMALICSGFLFFGKPFVIKWGGAEYEESYYIALLLIFAVTVPLIQNMGIEIQRAKNLHSFRSYVYLAVALLNVTISIPLGKRYLGIGCAIGTAFALVIGNGFIMNWFYYKKCEIDIPLFWKTIFSMSKGLVIPFLSGMVLVSILDLSKVAYLIVGIIVYSLIYGVSMWFFGTNDYEKNIVRRSLLKIFGEKK